MNRGQFERDVLALLRTEYVVADAHLESGGKHPKVCFTYGGHPYVTPYPLSPHSDWQSAFNRKRQDLRRMLGPPPDLPPVDERTVLWEKPKPEPRKELSMSQSSSSLGTLADVMPSKPTTSAQRAAYVGRCSLLAPTPTVLNPRLVFSIPHALYRAFGHGGAVTITRVDDEIFEIEPRPGFKSPRFFRVNGEVYAVITEKTVVAKPDTVYWGASPAEFLLVDGHLLVTVPVATRRQIRGWRRHDAPVVTPPPTAPAATPLPAATAPSSTSPFDAAVMRSILESVRQIEAETPYRLVKTVSGAWAFRAPTID